MLMPFEVFKGNQSRGKKVVERHTKEGCWCRVISSLKNNLTYYLSIAAAGVVGIGLLLISGRLHASDLLPLAMLLSNTYGKASPTHAVHSRPVLQRKLASRK